jgi:hypothetical protein
LSISVSFEAFFLALALALALVVIAKVAMETFRPAGALVYFLMCPTVCNKLLHCGLQHFALPGLFKVLSL